MTMKWTTCRNPNPSASLVNFDDDAHAPSTTIVIRTEDLRNNALTAGVKYGWQLSNGNDMSVRLELYQQRGDIPANLLIGNQIGTIEYPDLDAVIVQFSYGFGR